MFRVRFITIKIKMYVYYIMESGRMMVLHSVVIGLVLYAVMVYGLGQKCYVAENRSILIASLSLAYMIIFGHNLPTKVNKSLF
jgi:hypothetical protein